MVFGVSYHVIGRADCPYFARAERLAQMVQQSLSLTSRDIVIESIHPSNWSDHVTSIGRRYGFTDFLRRQRESQSPDLCLVWNARTRRLVGGEKAFRKEIAAKYGIECDLPWSLLQSIARENYQQYDKLEQAKAHRKQAQPLILCILGPNGAGSTTLARKIEASYGLLRINPGEILRSIVDGGKDVPSMLTPDHLATIRSCLASGELVPDEIMVPLMRLHLVSSDSLLRAGGAVLDGWPRTADQAKALIDLETQIGAVRGVYKLTGLNEADCRDRIQGRRVDPLNGDVYHETHIRPPQALILARTTLRSDDALPNAPRRIHAQYRAYIQNAEHLFPIFESGVVREIVANLPPDQVWHSMNATLEPLVNASLIARTAALALESAGLKEAASQAALAALRASPVVTPNQRTLTQPHSSPLSSPVPVTPTPAQVAEGVVATMPLSRRASLHRSMELATAQAAAMLAAQAAAAAATATATPSSESGKSSSRRASRSTKSNSRRSSLNASKEHAPVASASATATATGVGSRRSSLTTSSSSRRTSAAVRGSMGPPLIPPNALRAVPAQAVTHIASATSPIVAEPLHSRPSSATSSTSHMATPLTPLSPADEPSPTAAAAAAVTAAATSSVPIIPSVSSRPTSAVPSRPISASRPISSRPSSTSPSKATPEVARGGEEVEEEVVLHKSKRSTKRASIPIPVVNAQPPASSSRPSSPAAHPKEQQEHDNQSETQPPVDDEEHEIANDGQGDNEDEAADQPDEDEEQETADAQNNEEDEAVDDEQEAEQEEEEE